MWGHIVLSRLRHGEAPTQHVLAADIGDDNTRLIAVLATAQSRPRTAHRSGNNGVNRVLRRYVAPDDPPVPDLSPIVRSTIFTCR
jgi:hypothetical protein